MKFPKEVATEERPAPSPSNRYVLKIITEWEGTIPLQGFQVMDANGHLIFSPQKRFDARHMTYFLWDTEDRIWVYSGDEGTFFWEYDPNKATWEKRPYTDGKVPAPEFLKQVRPKWHRY